MRCAFDKGDECSALNKKDCEGCSFYKTLEDVVSGRRAIISRLEELGVYENMSRQCDMLKDVYAGLQMQEVE